MIGFNDLWAVYEVGRDYFNPVGLLFMAFFGSVYLLKRHDEVVAFAVRSGRYLHYLAVRKGLQGQGFGEAVFVMVRPDVDSLRVKNDNPAAIRLYEKHGFRLVGESWWLTGKRLLMKKMVVT